jgi:hypothetical protein
LLRHQLAIYERKQGRAPHLSRGEKLMLIVLASRLKARTGRTIKVMGDVIRIVKPATLFWWHSELVRRKWTYRCPYGAKINPHRKSTVPNQKPSSWKNPTSMLSLRGFCLAGKRKSERLMFFRVILFVWDFVLDLVAVSRMTDDEKDLEILLLRQQLRIVERKQERGPQIPRWQKVALVALALRLKQRAIDSRQALEDSVRLFKPATVLGWHREIVRRKWTYQRKSQSGRPPIDAELEQWILRVARDNPGLGYDKLKGELRKLGFKVSPTTIRIVLQRHGIPPAPERSRSGSSWRTFLTHYKEQFLACDFLTVETLTLQSLYVLFFIEHATRRVYLAGWLHRSSGCGLGLPTSPPDDLGVARPRFTHALPDPRP